MTCPIKTMFQDNCAFLETARLASTMLLSSKCSDGVIGPKLNGLQVMAVY
jgi:hypothetical protein